MIWLQECLVCNYKESYGSNPEKESIIRASCLPCGHQGAFTLKEITKEQKIELLKRR
jgi:hypothetical protein